MSRQVGKNKIEWDLDEQGRPVEARASLKEVYSKARVALTKLKAQRTLAGKLDSDQAGHVVGHRFGLDQGGKNLFPQDANLNNSAYKKFENELADWVDAGGEVDVTYKLDWPDGATRPDAIDIEYVVKNDAGEVIYQRLNSFDNQAGEVFDRMSKLEIEAMLAR